MPSKTLTIRFPSDLKKKLAAAAKADDRSITSFIVHIVREALAQRQYAEDVAAGRRRAK